jgi:hypothetical protein
METKLFHQTIFVPKEITAEVIAVESHLKNYKLVLSKHVHLWCEQEKASRKDEYAPYDYKHAYIEEELEDVFNQIQDKKPMPFEIEITRENNNSNWLVSKIVVRINYSYTRDISIAIAIDSFNKIAFIKTAWFNSINDNHLTLNPSPYCTEIEWKESK